MKLHNVTFFAEGVLTAGLCLLLVNTARAAVIVSEVNANGSSAAYSGDWFELTNTGAAAVGIGGWKVDDGSNLFGSAIALTGVSSIDPGQSAIFIEGSAATATSFINTWFGGTAPAGFAIGSYSGSGIGLSSGGDAVNIFDGGGVPVASVTFGATSLGATLNNAAGLTGAISALSVVGINGAFTAGPETGSPGTITSVPEPGSALLLLLSASVLTSLRTVNHRRIPRS